MLIEQLSKINILKCNIITRFPVDTNLMNNYLPEELKTDISHILFGLAINNSH